MERVFGYYILVVSLVLYNQPVSAQSVYNMPKTAVNNKWFWFRGSSYMYNYVNAEAICESYGFKLAYMDSTSDYTEIFNLFCGENW